MAAGAPMGGGPIPEGLGPIEYASALRQSQLATLLCIGQSGKAGVTTALAMRF